MSAPVRLVRWAAIALGAAIFAVFVWYKVTNPWQYWHLAAQEDALVEWLSAIAYLMAGILAAVLFVRFSKAREPLMAALSAVLAVGMIFIGMEEISWGQRIFGIASPEFFLEANRQQEINFHNLGQNKAWLDFAYVAVAFYGLTARYWVPFLAKKILGERGPRVSELVCPPGFLAPYFAVPFLLYLYYVNVPWLVETFGPQWGYAYLPESGNFMISRDQEPAEFMLSLGFLFFAAWLIFLQRIGVWRSEKDDPVSAA